jgi:hypothetical protein
MSADDLLAECRWALTRTKPADLDPLRKAGIGEAQLAAIKPAWAPIGVTRDGLHFQPDPDGDAFAFIVPVRVHNPLSPEARDPVATVRGGAIVDLLAFSAAVPNRWALRTGAAAWLGCVEPQYMGPAPTPIWRTPLRWLGEGCGVCLLSRDRRDQYRTLASLDSIIAEDKEHADELRRLLAHPWLAPPVYVRRGREIARHAA